MSTVTGMDGRDYLALPDDERDRIAAAAFEAAVPNIVRLTGSNFRHLLDQAARDNPDATVTELVDGITQDASKRTPQRPRPFYSELRELIETAEADQPVDPDPLRTRIDASRDQLQAMLDSGHTPDDVPYTLHLLDLYRQACDHLTNSDVRMARAAYRQAMTAVVRRNAEDHGP